MSLQKGNEARAEGRAAAILRAVDGTQKMAGEDQGSEEDFFFFSSPVAPALPPAIKPHQEKLGVERNPGTILLLEKTEGTGRQP